MALARRADAPDALDQIMALTGGLGCEVSIDCSGSPQGRLLALQGTRRWGRSAMVGEGSTVAFDVSQTIIHNQITVYGSWVTSLGHMEDLVEKLVEWNLKPEITVSHRFTLDQAAEAGYTALGLLGGEPTLHPDLSVAVKRSRELGYGSVTVDTNGYLFHDILDRVTPDEVDFFSFSLDGATRETNDRIRGAGSFDTCIAGIRKANSMGFATSLIFTASSAPARGPSFPLKSSVERPKLSNFSTTYSSSNWPSAWAVQNR